MSLSHLGKELNTIWYSISTPNQTHFWGIVSLIWRILKHGPKSSLLLHFVVFYLLLLLVDPFFSLLLLSVAQVVSNRDQSTAKQRINLNLTRANICDLHDMKRKYKSQIQIFKYRFKIFRKKFVKLLSGASFEAKVKNCFTRISTLDTLLKDAFTYKHIKFIYQYKMYVNILLCRYVQIYR